SRSPSAITRASASRRSPARCADRSGRPGTSSAASSSIGGPVRAADDRILAIMMKAPRAGRVKTRLAAAYSPEQIVELYRALVGDTVELARQVRARTVAVCPAGDEADLVDWLPPTIEIVVQ